MPSPTAPIRSVTELITFNLMRELLKVSHEWKCCRDEARVRITFAVLTGRADTYSLINIARLFDPSSLECDVPIVYHYYERRELSQSI